MTCSLGCPHWLSLFCLCSLHGPSPSMDSKALELFRVRFTHRSKSYYCCSELRPNRRGVEPVAPIQLLPSLFQRSFDKAARVRIQMSGNFVEGHDLTSPLGVVQNHRPPSVNDLVICIVTHPATRSESLSRTATSFVQHGDVRSGARSVHPKIWMPGLAGDQKAPASLKIKRPPHGGGLSTCWPRRV
jgi:hypothetical protein